MLFQKVVMQFLLVLLLEELRKGDYVTSLLQTGA
jgi:hypothetical protein